MKLILATALFASMIAPVAAVAAPQTTAAFETLFGSDSLAERRSGTCPRHGLGVMREGSACGGV